MKSARLEFLVDTFGNSKGDVVRVRQETKIEYDYYDSFHRWCYVLKSEEGTIFKYIPARQKRPYPTKVK